MISRPKQFYQKNVGPKGSILVCGPSKILDSRESNFIDPRGSKKTKEAEEWLSKLTTTKVRIL